MTETYVITWENMIRPISSVVAMVVNYSDKMLQAYSEERSHALVYCQAVRYFQSIQQ